MSRSAPGDLRGRHGSAHGPIEVSPCRPGRFCAFGATRIPSLLIRSYRRGPARSRRARLTWVWSAGQDGHSACGLLYPTALLPGFPVFSCRGGRCGPAVTGGVQPMLPAAGLPIRLRPGLTRRPSSACAAARPGPPAGHRTRRSGLPWRSRAPSAAAGGACATRSRAGSSRVDAA